MIKRIRRAVVEQCRTDAVSIVGKGAATNSDAYLLQAAPAFVPDTTAAETEYPIVALVQEHLDALNAEDQQKALAQIVAALEQGPVSDALQRQRQMWPDFDLFDAFRAAWTLAATDEERKVIIADFAVVLIRELMGEATEDDEGTMTQSAVGPVARALAEKRGQPLPEHQASTTDGAVTQTPADTAAAAPVVPEPDAPETLTQEAVLTLIQQALSPVQDALKAAQDENSATADRAGAAEKALEQARTDLAVERSKNAPRSAQPDAEPGIVVQQATEPTSPYANSGLDAWLKQSFVHR